MAFDGFLDEARFQLAVADVYDAAADALMTPPASRISAWVDEGHIVLTEKTNTPRPGPLSFEGIEYLREPLDRLHPDDPCSRATIKGGAQTGKSTVGQCWVAWSIENNPKSFAIGLPTQGEVGKYNDIKLQPIIDDSPTLKPKVRPVSTKSNEGSSAKKKRLYNGASIVIFNLSSPAELQMISTGNLILEEVANALEEVGARGNPIKQARERQAAYSVVGSKELMISTPGELGTCEVTKAYEAGDQREYYGLCPGCGGYWPMRPEGLERPEDAPPRFVCPGAGCGSIVEDVDRAAWRVAGDWVPTFRSENLENPEPPDFIPAGELERWKARDVEGRQPSWQVWQAMCGLISLAKVAESVATAKTAGELKALDQQVFGRAHDPAVDALDWEDLHRLREDYESGIVPAGAEVLTAFCDVQGAYLQWGVLAWGPGAEWWVVDRGIETGDTSADEVWQKLDQVTRRTYPHALGGELGIDAFGIDTGYRTQRVYAFTRGRPNCYAMDGRAGWKTPILGKATIVKVIQNGRVIGRTKLWPTGTWELKSELAWSLKASTEAGYAVRVQGRGHWSLAEDEAWAQQITAEYLREEKNKKTGLIDRWWAVVSGRRNEEVDIWVGARALAWNLGVGAPRRDRQPGEAADWQAFAARRAAPGGGQADLFAANAVRVRTPDAETPAAPAPASARPKRFFRSRT